MSEITGSVSLGIESLGKVLNLKGRVLPLTEESNNTLVAELYDGGIVYGEHNITEDVRKIKKVWYKDDTEVCKEALKAIKNADLIVLSMGSLYTSIIPNLICNEIKDAIDKSNAEVMYVCNIVTQPGETDNFKVSDHVNALNEYLGDKKVSVVVANSGAISKKMAEKYSNTEQKDPVIFDKKTLKNMGLKIISDDFVTITDDTLRHDVIKLGLQIFTYLLEG